MLRGLGTAESGAEWRFLAFCVLEGTSRSRQAEGY